MKRVEIIKDSICSKRIDFGKLIKWGDNLLIERDIFFIKVNSSNWVIGPTNLFLCVLDIFQSRFPRKLYWLLADSIDKYPISMYNIGTKLIEKFIELRKILKNDFFKFMSN